MEIFVVLIFVLFANTSVFGDCLCQEQLADLFKFKEISLRFQSSLLRTLPKAVVLKLQTLLLEGNDFDSGMNSSPKAYTKTSNLTASVPFQASNKRATESDENTNSQYNSLARKLLQSSSARATLSVVSVLAFVRLFLKRSLCIYFVYIYCFCEIVMLSSSLLLQCLLLLS